MKSCLMLALLVSVAFSVNVAQGDAEEVDLYPKELVEFREKIDADILAAEHPLIVRHLVSIRSMVESEWASASLPLPELSERRKVSLEHIARISKELGEDSATWSPYISRRQRLTLAFNSPQDGSLHVYRLVLPENWSPDKEYPMIVFLHGAGDPHLLRFVWRGLELPFDFDKDKFVDIDATSREAYVLEPRDRGAAFRGIGEKHVFDIIEDVRKYFKVDEDRISLTGFSMGSNGTWSIALRNPDRWAAIATMSGRTDPTLGTGIEVNMAHLPTLIWAGGDDVSAGLDSPALKQEALGKVGNDAQVIIIPGIGHECRNVDRENIFKWLLQHRRQRPDQFTFISDTDEHVGAFGISMMRNQRVNPQSKFTCRIEGDTVHIDSEGTEGLAVELGEGGLGLDGEVTVFWNGEQQYKGPVGRVLIGEYAERQSRR